MISRYLALLSLAIRVQCADSPSGATDAQHSHPAGTDTVGVYTLVTPSQTVFSTPSGQSAPSAAGDDTDKMLGWLWSEMQFAVRLIAEDFRTGPLHELVSLPANASVRSLIQRADRVIAEDFMGGPLRSLVPSNVPDLLYDLRNAVVNAAAIVREDFKTGPLRSAVPLQLLSDLSAGLQPTAAPSDPAGSATTAAPSDPAGSAPPSVDTSPEPTASRT
jgi:hypothetical protein